MNKIKCRYCEKQLKKNKTVELENFIFTYNGDKYAFTGGEYCDINCVISNFNYDFEQLKKGLIK